jgi:hypothetical protein
MSQDMLTTLKIIDAKTLLDIVRQDQRSSMFELLDWEVKRLSEKGIVNPDGLFLFSGQGHDNRGTSSWSVVLKILKAPGVQQPLHDLFYWKRELLVAQSELLANLFGRLVPPRYYGLSEHDGQGWLWMEHIIENAPQSWTKDNYTFAAHQLGRFNGAYLTGLPLPDAPWLCKEHPRSMWNVFAPYDGAWDNARVRQFFSNRLRERVMKLWDERELFLDTLNRLPQTFSHFDFSRRNLLIRARNDGQEEVVAVDWALCGCGAVGGDLSSLIGTSAALFGLETTSLPDIEAAVFEAYVTGLREAGWTGNAELARLGYTAYLPLFWGVCFPTLIADHSSDEQAVRRAYGCSREELASTWATLCEYALDRADEARELMARLPSIQN